MSKLQQLKTQQPYLQKAYEAQIGEEQPYVYKGPANYKFQFFKKHGQCDKNIIRVKSHGDNFDSEEKNLKQVQYAKRCIVDFGHKDVKVLARGPAIKRGVKIVTELEKSLKQLSDDFKVKISGHTYLNFDQECKFGFTDPERNNEYLTHESSLFLECGASIQMKLEKLMTFKDPNTNHGLKPCIQINFKVK